MSTERDRSVSDLLHSILASVQHIIRSEFLLAKTELKEEGWRAAKPVSVLAAGAVIACYAMGFLLLFCVYALATVIGSWAAALAVGLALAVISAALLAVGIVQVRQMNPPAQKTLETLRENVQWTNSQ